MFVGFVGLALVPNPIKLFEVNLLTLLLKLDNFTKERYFSIALKWFSFHKRISKFSQ
jgi:hypothetical protein